ncbi:cupin domain-containing protein [Paenibacillus sp. 7541]|uniref:cupin domain-containing protein n=1 Tax=Paenibacillus sp. 7541 TaxID=2026236 RepID=UPI000BA6C37C|nr:cupin domain-containing protein [Paenibacillus sp. 7541]PAK54310.1 glucose-6-phosphate isomerase [Paenibacillus sp. 7541]
MAVSYMDFTSPNVQFSFDLNQSTFIKKDNRNYINLLSVNELNTLGNASLLDIFLSRGNVIEPHTHQNASEIVYCISGAADVSLINPFTKKLLQYSIKPGQVVNVPQGWWHYEMATVDNTHLLAVFDAPIPQFIGASDMLRLTPPGVFAHTYCLDKAKVQEALAPIKGSVVIGPPANCSRQEAAPPSAASAYSQPTAEVSYPDEQEHIQPFDWHQLMLEQQKRLMQQQQEMFEQKQAQGTPYSDTAVSPQPEEARHGGPARPPVIGNGWDFFGNLF